MGKTHLIAEVDLEDRGINKGNAIVTTSNRSTRTDI